VVAHSFFFCGNIARIDEPAFWAYSWEINVEQYKLRDNFLDTKLIVL
jgi:hypothetical protein